MRTILIIDDHPGTAKALRDVVDSVLVAIAPERHRFIVVAHSLGEATELLLGRDLSNRAATIFLDLTLDSDTPPAEILRHVRIAAPPDGRLFIWSGAPYSDADFERVWHEGASGWVPKGLSHEDLHEAVRCALTLGFYLPSAHAAAPAPAAEHAGALTADEVRLARLVALDLDLQSIADTATRGSLAEATAKVAALCAKLGVVSLADAAARVRTLGMR